MGIGGHVCCRYRAYGLREQQTGASRRQALLEPASEFGPDRVMRRIRGARRRRSSGIGANIFRCPHGYALREQHTAPPPRWQVSFEPDTRCGVNRVIRCIRGAGRRPRLPGFGRNVRTHSRVTARSGQHSQLPRRRLCARAIGMHDHARTPAGKNCSAPTVFLQAPHIARLVTRATPPLNAPLCRRRRRHQRQRRRDAQDRS